MNTLGEQAESSSRDAPLLSVIMPARNEEQFIGVQLEALATQQTTQSWELIVVDNGSTDRTGEVARSFSTRVPHLRVIDEPIPGACQARLAGATAAHADHLAFCDADDVVSETWVSAMIDLLSVEEMGTGPLDLDRLNGVGLRAMRGSGAESALPTFFGLFPYCRGNNLGIRSEVLERLGGWDPRFAGAEDIELSLRAWKAGTTIGFTELALVHYRYRSSPKGLWRQGLSYGKTRPAIKAVLKRDGLPTPPALAGWKSWIALVRSLGTLTSQTGRCNVAWIAGNRFGQVIGSVRERTVLL